MTADQYALFKDTLIPALGSGGHPPAAIRAT